MVDGEITKSGVDNRIFGTHVISACSVRKRAAVHDTSPFLARGELSGWPGNQNVKRKQRKTFYRFSIVSSSR